MTVNSYTCKIPVIDSNYNCIIHSEWSSTEIKLLLVHNNKAWSGEFQLVDNEDLSDLLDQLSLSQDVYMEECKKALTTQGGGDNFAYTIENENFTWKKYVRKNLQVKFGKVNLKNVPLVEAFEKVIDSTLQSNLTFISELQSSKKQREVLETENNQLKSKLNELIMKKDEMEMALYSQFLHLLNEKKKKIKDLKRKIPAEDTGDKMHSDSDHFDSDTEIDSEEEEKPSSSKVSFEGSSFDMDDEPVILPKRSRQKRSNDNVAGPSGEVTKVKTLKATEPKKHTVSGKKGQKRSSKDSCVFGKINEEVGNKYVPEESEDAFAFKTRSKRIVSSIKAVTREIKYESDEDTDLDIDNKLNCDLDKTPSGIEQAESDIDKTPSGIEQSESISGNIGIEQNGENAMEKNTFKQGTEIQRIENINKNGQQEEEPGNSEVATKPDYSGFSSSTLDILNQLV